MIGASVLPLDATILARVDPTATGAASGVAQAMQWVGGSLGIAILTSVIGSALRNAPSPATAAAASSAFVVADAFIIGALLVAAVVVRPRDPERAETGARAPAERVGPHPSEAIEPG